MNKAHDLGKKAENLYASYLHKSGYALLARNYCYLKAVARFDCLERKYIGRS